MSKDNKEVKISKAKGRPMLTWVGKKPLTSVKAFPAQHVEHFEVKGEPSQDVDWSDWPEKFPQGGLLFHGDNKDVLASLLANGFRGKVKLIYIDPPFDSGADYVRKVQLRGVSGTSKIDGEEYTLGEQIQYTDIWSNDNYLQFMYERLLLLKELLHENGNIYLHCDWHRSHQLRCLMDEIFGSDNIKNEIIWKRTSARSDSKTYNHIHDTILFYTKSSEFTWNKLLSPHPQEYLDRYYNYKEENGRRFMALNLTADGLRNGSSGKPWRGFDPNTQSNHWKYAVEKLDELDKQGRIYWPGKEGGWPRLKKYLDETEGRALQTIWDDVFTVNSQAAERTDYPTQKSESFLERIIKASSNEGDIVLDCFVGSGSTAATSQSVGRRWIGCDINKGSIQTTAKRLQVLFQEQINDLNTQSQQDMLANEKGSLTKPSQFCFNTYRVNDYDLQIQHNEAVELACEHIGITRNRSDHFFDGTLGNRLIKIIPFNHPLTPLDLEDLRAELHRRPEEERDITVVSLGMELAARGWLEEYNRTRPINKLHVIELRTDKKYGGFIKHEPLVASVNVVRKGDRILVEITDAFSPTIIQRLNMEQGVFRATIEDWRSVIDCIMIDTNYNGDIFNVALTDIPVKKADLVSGSYELEAPPDGSIVAVKVIDMLGEEAIITQAV